jgi:hypothetical protein
MLPSRSSFLLPALISYAVIASLACDRVQVSRRDEGPRGGVPDAMAGGFELPDALAGGLGLPDAGPASGPSAGPMDPAGAACATEVHQAERQPVDLLLLIDSSGSMGAGVPNGTRTKASLVSEALTTFVKDPRSDGLGIGLRFFPGVRPPPPLRTTLPACQSDAECDAPSVCRRYRVCPGPIIGQCVADILGAGETCPFGGACVEAGRCALSKFPCVFVGQLCPGGMPGDLCEAAAPTCLAPAPELMCETSGYEKLAAPFAALPGAEARLSQALQNGTPWGDTPMGPALAGALAHARKHQTANPTHRVALVLATDGVPSGGCEPADAAEISALVARALMGAPPITTYAIGVFAQRDMAEGRALLASVATAGGTGKPFVLNSDPDLARTFQDALEKIRQETALACEFMIPAPNGPVDFGKVNVHLQNAAGSGEDIPYVSAADRCDPTKGGWFYDVDPAMTAPTRVLTCPATCNRLKGEPTASVSLVFGCRTRAID